MNCLDLWFHNCTVDTPSTDEGAKTGSEMMQKQGGRSCESWPIRADWAFWEGGPSRDSNSGILTFLICYISCLNTLTSVQVTPDRKEGQVESDVSHSGVRLKDGDHS